MSLFDKRIDDDNPLARLIGLPVVQSRYVPKGSAFCFDDLTLIFPTPTENTVATSTAQIRVRVYGGPHHGRVLLIPAKSPRFVTLPNPMPAGEMFCAGRSNPSAFSEAEYTYEVKRGVTEGGVYLGFVEGHARNFSIPQPSIRISRSGLNLARDLRAASMAYGEYAGNSAYNTNQLYSNMQAAEKALVEYIAKLEAKDLGINRDATVRY